MSGQRNQERTNRTTSKEGWYVTVRPTPVTTATQTLRYGTALQGKETWESIGSVALRVFEMCGTRYQKLVSDL